jgi:hypothetical protein
LTATTPTTIFGAGTSTADVAWADGRLGEPQPFAAGIGTKSAGPRDRQCGPAGRGLPRPDPEDGALGRCDIGASEAYSVQ